MKKLIVALAVMLIALCMAMAESQSLTLDGNGNNIAVGEQLQLTAYLNGIEETAVVWSTSDESIASVTADGVLTGVSEGQTAVTCENEAGERAVLNITVTGVKIENISSVMGRGEWRMLSVSSSADISSCKVKYSSSNQNVMSCTSEGKIIALKEGEVTITATLENGMSASFTVTIIGRPSTLKISIDSNELGVGQTAQITTVLDKGTAGRCTFKSKKESVATVDENGVVTAVSKGEAVIEVTTYNMITQKLTVKVGEAPSAVEISDTKLELGVGQLYSLFARVSAGYGKCTFCSSDESIVAVSEDGLVTAVSEGTCTIKAVTYNGVSAECVISVCPAPEGLWAWVDGNSMGVGETLKVQTQVEPYSENSVTVYFESSNESVATVSSDGTIKATGKGSAVINVYTYNGISRTIQLNVGTAPKSISINVPSNVVAVGETVDWDYTYDSGAAGGTEITVSDSSILQIGDGILTGISAGQVKLTVTAYNGVTASAVLTVMQKADSLSFVTDVYNLEAGSVSSINAVVPENTCANIDYSIADESVCVMLADGRIMALRSGETVLTATAFDGELADETVLSVQGTAETIDLSNTGLSGAECAALQTANPDITFLWHTTAFGVTVNSTDETLDLSNNKNISSLDDIRKLLDAFPKLNYLDLSYTGFEYEDLAELREEYRGTCKIVWTIYICNRWEIRTDQTAFSTLLGQDSVHHTSKEFDALKYCEDMLAIDLGHNNLSSLDFLLGMPHLRIIILSDSNVSDITVLGQLTELEYVEIFTNNITDISPLANLTNMIDLNISNNNITDLTPIMGLEKLGRVWMTHIKASDSQKNEFISTHPDCEVNTTAKGPDRHGWRSHHNYFVIYQIFHTNVWIPWDTEVDPAPDYQKYY